MRTAFVVVMFLVLFANTPAQDNLARKALRATASSWRPEFPPKDAIDGDMGTSFSVALDKHHDQWFQLDWAIPQLIGGFAIWQPDRYTLSLDVELLEQGEWVRVAHAGAPDERLGRNVYVTFEPQRATAMRLVHMESTEVGGTAFYEIGVYSDPSQVKKMQNAVDVAIAGDSTGRLIGTVSTEAGSAAVSGAQVKMSGTNPAGPWSAEARTNEHGFFVADLPLHPTGPIAVRAELGEKAGEATADASDIATRLTPRPQGETLDLQGEWQFLPDPPSGWVEHGAKLPWRPIQVPSNYEMQGFRAETDTAAYRKLVPIPAAWAGKRILLRPEAIYSFAEVWLNGKRVGSHEGGATPFVLDLTGAAKPGAENELCVFVKGRSRSEGFDHMSVYAYFEIAGIWRPISMYCVEPSHIERLTYAVHFDPAYRDARLAIDVKVANERSAASSGALDLTILDPSGKALSLPGLTGRLALEPWTARTIHLETTVRKPKQWNAELPRNYRIVAHWKAADQPAEILEQPLGFRQVEIKGRAFSINGKPVRLFGTCLHTADPLMGRAITIDRVKQDLELIKQANLNAFRTSHYPPQPSTPAVADQVGLYIEDEGPSCWADGNEDLRNAPMYVGIVSEYIERDRNHPSVVYWSTCNESHYGIVFQLAHRYAKALDPTRPVGGSYAPLEMDNDVYVIHHPTNIYDDIEKTKALAKPVFYDECLSVPHGWGNLALSEELDPGMHSLWEWKIPEIRSKIMAGENQVGTMSWAWVDDAFLMPGRGVTNSRMEMPQILYADPIYKMPGRGYQGDTVWGMVDGWRRPRPEWWGAKKSYSPILIEEKPLAVPAPGEAVVIPVENKNWFANLSAYKCRWLVQNRARGVVRPDVPPSSKGVLTIKVPGGVTPADVLDLRFYDETGRLVDGYSLRFRPHPAPSWALGKPAGIHIENGRYLSGANAVFLRGEGAELAFDQVSGGMMWGLKGDEQILVHGPTLHLLKSADPMGAHPAGWKFAEEAHAAGQIQWNGAFAEDLRGGYTIKMDAAGQVEVDYSFKYSGPDVWVREIGLDFELPLTFDRLSWDKRSEHSFYPADHIDRPCGSVLAHPKVAQSVPPKGRPFALDDYPWGCNDFRSTKRHILWASLTNPAGQGLRVISDGTQHARATVGVHTISLKVLDFYGGLGAPTDWAVEGFHYGAGHEIKTGDTLSGRVRVQMVGATTPR